MARAARKFGWFLPILGLLAPLSLEGCRPSLPPELEALAERGERLDLDRKAIKTSGNPSGGQDRWSVSLGTFELTAVEPLGDPRVQRLALRERGKLLVELECRIVDRRRQYFDQLAAHCVTTTGSAKLEISSYSHCGLDGCERPSVYIRITSSESSDIGSNYCFVNNGYDFITARSRDADGRWTLKRVESIEFLRRCIWNVESHSATAGPYGAVWLVIAGREILLLPRKPMERAMVVAAFIMAQALIVPQLYG